jgi:hypothetical protein
MANKRYATTKVRRITPALFIRQHILVMTTKEFAAALCKAQGAMKAAGKDKVNPAFKSRYADLAAVVDAARKPLADNGLSVVQSASATETGVAVTTLILHESGQWIETDPLCIPVTKKDAHGTMGAITYAKRGSLMAAFALAGDVDDDGNAATVPAAEPEVDSVEWEFQALYSRAGKRKRKAELAAALGNPATQQEALAAYRAMSEEQRTLAALTVEHRDLDEAIARMVESPLQDELQVRRLKRRKLLLKDQIVWLERQLAPDDRA